MKLFFKSNNYIERLFTYFNPPKTTGGTLMCWRQTLQDSLSFTKLTKGNMASIWPPRLVNFKRL